jgi:antitoxin CptB
MDDTPDRGAPDRGDFAAWRRRLRFRSWHRGTREMDLLLGGFADSHLDAFTAAEMRDYETLLTREDPDLWDWITDRAPVPPAEDSPTLRRVIAHCRRD